jgi:hypothetical protein
MKCGLDCAQCERINCKNRTDAPIHAIDLTGLKPKESRFTGLLFKYVQTAFYSAFVLATVVMGGVSTYWLLESDPVIISKIPGQPEWSVCDKRYYKFHRYVYSSRDVSITVQQRYIDLDNMTDENGIENERIYTDDIPYQLAAGFEKNMEFTKPLPANLPIGRYEYRPWARYKINPLKEIYRPLPVQRVEVTCDYDPAKHGVMQ